MPQSVTGPPPTPTGPATPKHFLGISSMPTDKRVALYGGLAAAGVGGLALAKEVGVNVLAERLMHRFPRLRGERTLPSRAALSHQMLKAHTKFFTKMQAHRAALKELPPPTAGVAGEPRDSHGRWTTA